MRRVVAMFALVAAYASAQTIPSPQQYFGFPIGADRKIARYDKIIAYLQTISALSPRVKFQNLGPTTGGNPFVMVEISSAANIRNLDHLRGLERKLYFQGGAPTDAEREEIFRDGKAVVFLTNNIHSTEIGSSQMVLDLVHRLETDDSP
jgi:hypothetical protein